MLGAVLKGLGKVECSEYWLLQNWISCSSSQQKATKGHGKARPVSRPGSATVSQATWASVSLCETGLLVYIVSSSTCNFRDLWAWWSWGLGLREAGVVKEGKINGVPYSSLQRPSFQALLGSGLSGVCVCVFRRADHSVSGSPESWGDRTGKGLWPRPWGRLSGSGMGTGNCSWWAWDRHWVLPQSRHYIPWDGTGGQPAPLPD